MLGGTLPVVLQNTGMGAFYAGHSSKPNRVLGGTLPVVLQNTGMGAFYAGHSSKPK